MKDTVIAIIVTVCLIAILELHALHLGVDGKVLAGSIAAMAALVAGYTGYKVKERKIKNGNK